MSSGRVAKNFLALASGDALARVVAFGASVWIARTLGPEFYGIVGFATAVVLYFANATECGMDLLGVRDVGEDPERAGDFAAALNSARFCVGLALAGVLAALALTFLPRLDGIVLATYGLTLLAVGPSPKWVHLGLGNPRPVALGRTLGEATFLLLVLLTVRERGPDVAAVPGAQLAGDAVGVLCMLLLLQRRRGAPLAFRLDWARVRPVFARSWPLVANSLLGLTIYNSDLLFLRFFEGRETVGLYAAGYQLISFLQNIGAAFSMSLLPLMARALGDLRAREALYHDARAHVFAVALPTAVGGAWVARSVIESVYGADYALAALPLAVLLCGIPFTLSKEVDLVALVASGHTRAVMRMTSWAVALNVALNLTLIPRYGIVGAAFATATTEVLRALLAGLYARRRGFSRAGARRFAKPTFAAGAMLATLALADLGALWRELALGALSYAAALALAGGLGWRAGRPVLRV